MDRSGQAWTADWAEERQNSDWQDIWRQEAEKPDI